MRRFIPLPISVPGDKIGENYQNFVVQPSCPVMSRAMNINKFLYLSPRFIVQPRELSFMPEKM